MDGGIDDALALILALRSPELDVVGITAVSGNVPVGLATMNALRVVELLGMPRVWVAEGQARPLARDPIRAFDFHGKDGLGDSNLPLPRLRPTSKGAISAMAEALSSSKEREVTLIGTGPLTNLASLLLEYPDAKRKIDEIVIMGGAYGVTEYGVGNETPVAEFNIFSDPEAARIVFEADVTLKAVGLDVTTIPRLELGKDDFARTRKNRGKVSKFAARILEKSMRVYGRFTLHDPMAVAVEVRPSFYRFLGCRVSVETRGEYTTGMTVVDRRGWLRDDRLLGRSVMVCRQVRSGFKRLFLERLGAA